MAKVGRPKENKKPKKVVTLTMAESSDNDARKLSVKWSGGDYRSKSAFIEFLIQKYKDGKVV